MQIVCTDFYGKKHLVTEQQLIVRLSAYGVYVDDSAVLLVQDPRSLRWELPGGGIEKNETPKQCLTREFIEETGAIPSGHILFLKEWEEYFFDVVSQQAWRSKRRFYSVENLKHQEKLLIHGNGEDSARAEMIPISKLSTFRIAPSIREIIQENV